MKRNITLLIVGGLAVAAAGIGGSYWYAMQRMGSMAAPQPAATGDAASALPADGGKAAATGERTPLYWHDPMVPGPKFDKPGKSPFMDMQLVPVYADAGADQGSVSISPRTVQNLGIRTVEVTMGRMNTGLTTVGAVSIDERTMVTVQSRVSGYIEKLHVRAQYDGVARGQPLAEIYAPEWLAAQEEYLALKRSAQTGVSDLAQAARQRLLLLGISEQQIRNIEQSGKADARITLSAPVGGLVWELGARDGMAVNPGLTLFRLVSLDSVWINAEIAETDAALVKPGATVAARTAAFPEQTFNGKVALLLPDVNATTRTIKARIVLANPGGRLKPGMSATLSFASTDKPALMVPSEAVIHTGTRAVAIVAEGDGKFRPVDIETGRDSGGMTEIRKGLTSGQRVVASGQFLIDSEASLKSTLTRLEKVQNSPANDPPGGGHVGNARINAVDSSAGKIDINHGPIPSMQWPAMTMGFRVEDKTLLQGLKAGDRINFEMRGEPDRDGNYIITRIQPDFSGSKK
ncbi:MAG: efflux RND transporter periplasmic adaptor subunit [Betaproteobacteria bacterium]